MSRNAYGAILYFNEVLSSSTGDRVLVDRDKLKLVVKLAKQTTRFTNAKATASRLSPGSEGK